LNSEGEVEMDASIMDGNTMKTGAVSGVQDIYHPITLARKVMDKTAYNFLGSKGAMQLAKDEGFNFLPKGTLVTQRAMDSLEEWRKRQNMTLKESVNIIRWEE
jgi:L-asparaginase / beta-aspartyl-peptidase